MLHSNILTQWPAQDRDLRCVFIDAGFVLTLPFTGDKPRCCHTDRVHATSTRTLSSRPNVIDLSSLHSIAIEVIPCQRRNGTVEKSNTRPLVFRPLCENVWVQHGCNFSYTAMRNEFRSTLKTSESLEWRTSARPKAHIMWPEQRAFVKIFPECQVLCSFLSAQKGEKRKTTKRINNKSIKVKDCPKIHYTLIEMSRHFVPSIWHSLRG